KLHENLFNISFSVLLYLSDLVANVFLPLKHEITKFHESYLIFLFVSFSVLVLWWQMFFCH
ncbi:MAG TPA: hypothetical protein PK665_04145, partial [Ignavibacteriaceae bacterium]|nr:hypothetical protein [Ignavibacteriaceae bacterium]